MTTASSGSGTFGRAVVSCAVGPAPPSSSSGSLCLLAAAPPLALPLMLCDALRVRNDENWREAALFAVGRRRFGGWKEGEQQQQPQTKMIEPCGCVLSLCFYHRPQKKRVGKSTGHNTFPLAVEPEVRIKI